MADLGAPVHITNDSLTPIPVATTGNSAATIADGADVAEGAKADTAATSSVGSFSAIALLKGLYALLAGVLTVRNYAAQAGTNLSGTVTSTSGGFNLAADATRKPGDVQGQNNSTTATIAFNEFNGTAVINGASSYTVVPGATFSISTNAQVNFISSAATSLVVITKLV